MKKRYLTILFVLLCAISVSAQGGQIIRGTVIDKISQLPLEGVNVYITASSKGSTSDEHGKFELKDVELGRIDIQFTYIGYKPVLRKNLNVIAGRELLLYIEMEEDLQLLEEVLVKAYQRKDQAINTLAQVSARSFTVEETEKYAGSLGDPSRMAQNFAGVVTMSDQRNDIVIRGNAPTGLLWRLDGFNIPNPNHFGAMGSTGGPVSMLNNNLLANSDFFTGAFPAEYGNALSGVFDLKMRPGNTENHQFLGQIGFNGFEFGAEGPLGISQNSSFIANYRYSTLAVFDALGMGVAGGGVPYYQDVTFKFNVPTKRAGTFSLIGMGGISSIEFLAQNENDGTYNNEQGLNTRNGTDIGFIGLSHLYFFNEKSRIKTQISLSGHAVKTKVDSLLSENEELVFYGENNLEVKYSFSSVFKRKVDVKNNYSIGFIADGYNIDFKDSSIVAEDTYYYSINSKKKGLFLIQSYAQWQHKFNAKLTAYAGMQAQFYTYNNTWASGPRASLNWEFAEKQNISIGYGLHSQIQPHIIYLTQSKTEEDTYVFTNKNLEMTKSHQTAIGYNVLFKENMRIKTELYFQYLIDVPVEKDPSYFSMVNYGGSFYQGRVDSLENTGTARNYGVELTVEKFFSNGYYFLFTSSLFDSKYKTNDGIERNSTFNQNFVFNLLGGYEHQFSKKTQLGIDFKGVFAGGKRFLNVDQAMSEERGFTIYTSNGAFEERSAPYFRIDLRLNLKLNGKTTSQEWAIDFQNLTNHKNIFNQTFNKTTGEVEYTYQNGFYPMFLYRIYF